MDVEAYLEATSRTGWCKVQEYNPRLWIPAPASMPEPYDERSWAREFAEAWWQMSGLAYVDRQVARLEAQLGLIYEGIYGHIPCHDAWLHLPDPRLTPLPVYLSFWTMEGDRDSRLRTLSLADDPGAVKPPVIEEFSTPKLGTGLKVLRYFQPDDESATERSDGTQGAIAAGLSYAWRCADIHTDVRMFSTAEDLPRLQQAIPDIDELAQGINTFPVNRDMIAPALAKLRKRTP
jgi:hypothetical protein